MPLGRNASSAATGALAGRRAEISSPKRRGKYVFSAPLCSPSPPTERGEGWGEEGRLAGRWAGVSAVECPSPLPSPRSFLTGRGSSVRALDEYRGTDWPAPPPGPESEAGDGVVLEPSTSWREWV